MSRSLSSKDRGHRGGSGGSGGSGGRGDPVPGGRTDKARVSGMIAEIRAFICPGGTAATDWFGAAGSNSRSASSRGASRDTGLDRACRAGPQAAHVFHARRYVVLTLPSVESIATKLPVPGAEVPLPTRSSVSILILRAFPHGA